MYGLTYSIYHPKGSQRNRNRGGLNMFIAVKIKEKACTNGHQEDDGQDAYT